MVARSCSQHQNKMVLKNQNRIRILHTSSGTLRNRIQYINILVCNDATSTNKQLWQNNASQNDVSKEYLRRQQPKDHTFFCMNCNPLQKGVELENIRKPSLCKSDKQILTHCSQQRKRSCSWFKRKASWC